MNSKLGIDVGGAANLDTTHLFSDEDLLMESYSDNNNQQNDTTKIGILQLKRKISQDFEIKSNIDIKQSVEEMILANDPSIYKKIKMEPEIENSETTITEEKKTTKPLEQFTKWLVEKLFNPDWESRHGASTSLREVLKKISFAPTIHKVNDLNDSIHTEIKSSVNLKLNIFFEYCLVKLLSVIALDRFADYIGDEAVAPVRETCAQIIGIISSHLNVSTTNMNRLAKLCYVLNSFIELEDDHCWEIRHSGIMSLKYTIAASAAMYQSNSKSENLNKLKLIFDLTFDNILRCLKDNDDDVRHVASTALEPVSNFLNNLLDINKIEHLIKILIDVLVNKLDDLATSCSNIMSLLSDLLTIKSNSLVFLRFLNGQSIIPHLIIFFQHSSIQVKKTALETINKIIVAINDSYKDMNDSKQNITLNFEALETKENLVQLFRLLFQQAILLPSEYAFGILENLIEQLWSTLCNELSIGCLINVCFPYITTWVLLMMHSPNQPIDSIYLVQQSNSFSSNIQNFNDQSKEYIGSNQIKFEEKLVKDLVVIKCRLLSARLLAKLFYRISFTDLDTKDIDSNDKPINVIINFLCSQINFKSGIQRFCFGLLMIEWGKLIFTLNKEMLLDEIITIPSANNIFKLSEQILQKVSTSLEENTIYFDEIAMLFTKLQKDTRSLINIFVKFNATLLENYLNQSVFTFEDVTVICNLAQTILNDPIQQAKLNLSTNFKIEMQTIINNLVDLNQQTCLEQENLQIRSSSSLASASIAIQCQSQRMNPLIRPLMDSIRFESNQDLQIIASRHLSVLLAHARIRSPNPIPKIFKNILSYLSNDPVKTPVIQQMIPLKDFTQTPGKDPYESNRYYGILSDRSYAQQFHSNGNISENSLEEGLILKSKNRSSSSLHLSEQNENHNANNTIKLQIEKRGAESTLKAICEIYEEKIEIIVPELIQAPLNQLELISKLDFETSNIKITTNGDFIRTLISSIESCEKNLSKYQDFANHLQLIEYLCTCGTLNSRLLKDKFLRELLKIFKFIKCPLSAIRHLVCRCVSSICVQETNDSMNLILEYLLDTLDNSDFNLFARQGSVELIYCLCERFGNLIIPFTVIFIVPILKRMCDLDYYVRNTASQCFATLIKLYPLGDSLAQKNDLSHILIKNENVLKIKYEQQDFLDQLMDNRKLKPYVLPHEVLKNVELRSYQQMGVNWLAFLKKFNLHGILCDDMGLGKTLQSICILAGDHYEKQKKYEKRIFLKSENLHQKEIDDSFLPSIIICPTTLTNHWFHEIERFVDNNCLNPLIYCGSVTERESLRRKFFSGVQSKIKSSNNKNQRYNILIVSYDIIRHDVNFVSSQQWNYCILDEGHLIKSSKTKLFKSIKQIRASNRLILTGTPIQNNVTELWCLFDFLIPG